MNPCMRRNIQGFDLLFKQHTSRFSKSLYHFTGFFNLKPEVFAQTFHAHTFGCTSVDHLFVKAYIVIAQRLLTFCAVGHLLNLQM